MLQISSRGISLKKLFPFLLVLLFCISKMLDWKIKVNENTNQRALFTIKYKYLARFSCHSIAFHYFVILNMIFDCPIFLSAKSKCDVQMDVVVLFQLFRIPISNYCIPDNVNAFENISTNYLMPFIASPLKKVALVCFWGCLTGEVLQNVLNLCS